MNHIQEHVHDRPRAEGIDLLPVTSEEAHPESDEAMVKYLEKQYEPARLTPKETRQIRVASMIAERSPTRHGFVRTNY